MNDYYENQENEENKPKVLKFLVLTILLIIGVFFIYNYNSANSILSTSASISEEDINEMSRLFRNANVEFSKSDNTLRVLPTSNKFAEEITYYFNGGVLNEPYLDSRDERTIRLFAGLDNYFGYSGKIEVQKMIEKGFTDPQVSREFSKNAKVYLGDLNSPYAILAYSEIFHMSIEDSKELGKYLSTGIYPHKYRFIELGNEIANHAARLSTKYNKKITISLLSPYNNGSILITATGGGVVVNSFDFSKYDFIIESGPIRPDGYYEEEKNRIESQKQQIKDSIAEAPATYEVKADDYEDSEEFIWDEDVAMEGDILTITSDKANLRKEPSINAEIVGYWVKGDKVTVYEVAEGDGRTWYKTDPNKDWWISENTVNGSI